LRPRLTRLAALALALALSLQIGCGEVLEPGQWGTLRYFGQLPGETPLRLVPPITDRDGNVYVLHGEPEWLGSSIYVGHRLGGWSGGCSAHKGELQVLHGFVGASADHAWWWSGSALAAVSGETGMCRSILSKDPTTGTEIDVLAVVPWVVDTPTRTTTLAFIRATSESTIYRVVVDLETEQYADPEVLEQGDVDEVLILGTGASETLWQGYVVVATQQGENWRTEALILDENGGVSATVPLDLSGDLTAYSIQGFLQASDAGLVAGLMEDGRLLIFNGDGGGTKSISEFEPLGLFLDDGELWVTGNQGGKPVAARLDSSGALGSAVSWQASLDAAAELGGAVDVLDERSDPSRRREWDDARPAFGGYPFISAHPLDNYTNGSTGWLVAGPGYSTGLEGMTAVAYGPVGIEIP